MTYLKPYKIFNNFLQNESFEPLLSWGIRMALSGTLPIVWGLATNRLNDAIWITVTAEAISWVEMKGSFNWRVRTLFAGALLAFCAGIIGTVTGNNILLSTLCMFFAAFFATQLKNLGDRASGLAICVYLSFIICNAFPENNAAAIQKRMMLIGIGAAWPIIVGIGASILMPVEQPFRRHIALIWRSIGTMVNTLSKSGVDAKAQNELFIRENEVRAAIDNSFTFNQKMVHQVSKQDSKEYQLLLLRKNAALTAVHVISMAEEMQHIQVSTLDDALRIKAATMLNALQQAVNHLSIYILTLKGEERLLAISQINRIKKLASLIKSYPLEEDTKQTQAIRRITQLNERSIKLLESALQRIELMGKDEPVYKSYSMIKTLWVWRPKQLWGNIKTLFNHKTRNTRYAIRTAIAAAIAMLIADAFKFNHGYWIPFSVMIISQPYFRATLQKAIDRVIGTLLGGVAGGLLLLLPAGLHAKEAMLFLSFMLMVYYMRKNYAIAAFIVTLNLVLLFALEENYSNSVMLERALCTIGGALLAVASGMALLPEWDKKYMPRHLAWAIYRNYEYFMATCYPKSNNLPWTRYKRAAETDNSDLFDSFTRYMNEPGSARIEKYYDIITSNIRITRDLNTIHIEQEERSPKSDTLSPQQLQLIQQIEQQYATLIPQLQHMLPSVKAKFILLNNQTQHTVSLNEAQTLALQKLHLDLSHQLQDLQLITHS